MKQFLKTMLVVMLALCLIGVMVACNNGGETEDPTDGNITTVGDANESEGDPTESDSEKITTDGSAGGETDDGTTDAGEDTETDTDTTPVEQPGMETEVDSGAWGDIIRPN